MTDAEIFRAKYVVTLSETVLEHVLPHIKAELLKPSPAFELLWRNR